MRFPRHADIDYAKYSPTVSLPETKYGLPREVAFCSRCVISNQRPNSAVEFQHTSGSQKATINFDSSGVCDACRVAEDKRHVDWNERERMLKELCDRFRRNDGHYDCLVPGSGGKDSFYAAHVLRTKYGMHPLTVTWAPHIYTEWGWRNFQSWLHAGFDNYLKTPNGRTHRLLTRLAVENLFHPFQPFILGQKMLAPKMALLTGLKLVFYGENETEFNDVFKQSKIDKLKNNSLVRDFFVQRALTSTIKFSELSSNDIQEFLKVSALENERFTRILRQLKSEGTLTTSISRTKSFVKTKSPK